MEYLHDTYWGLSGMHYLRFAIILGLGFLLKGFISNFLSKYVFKIFAHGHESEKAKNFANHIKKPFSNFIFSILAYVAVMQIAPLLEQVLIFGNKSSSIINQAAKAENIHTFSLFNLIEKIFFFVQIITFTNLLAKVMSFVFMLFIERAVAKDDKERQQLLPLLRDILKVLLWTCMIFVILGVVFKVNVAALIAGLGVGGIAIAFALKDSVENLLSSFMILLDKPFVIGDLIKINGVEGTVESVGFRSTEIRTQDKTLVSMPNRNLISNNLENFSERGARRIALVIGAKFGLSIEQIQAIVDTLKIKIDANPNIVGNTQIYVDGFGEALVNINVVYFIKMDTELPFQKVKEQINLQIYQVMSQYGPGFSFPEQNLISPEENNSVNDQGSELLPS